MNTAIAPQPYSSHSHSSWWRDWFNDIYLDVYAHRDEESAEAEARWTVSLLGLQPLDRVLDLCCGSGRHCRVLRKVGLECVIGLDYSLPLLSHARIQPPMVNYIRGDMRVLPLRDASLDAALSFFTSFGYFRTNTENLTVLLELSRTLRPGGRFLIDYLNPDYVRDHFQPRSERRQGGYVIREERRFSDDGERVEKEIVIENWGEEPRRFHESVRLYSLEDMKDLLDAAGLQTRDVLGGFGDAPFTPEKPRMVLFGEKASG